jgi:hypothetical protein
MQHYYHTLSTTLLQQLIEQEWGTLKFKILYFA